MSQQRPVPDIPGRASSHGAERGGIARFSRHRYELPLLCVFLCLAVLELLAVHLLLVMWSTTAAWILTALSLLAVGQIACLIRGMILHPVEIDGSCIHVRFGAAGHLAVPLGTVARTENVAFAPEQKGADVFRTTIMASPNLALHLTEPMRVRRRQVSIITLRLDEPAAFMAQMAARQSRQPQDA